MSDITPLVAFAPPLVSTLTLLLLFSYLYSVHRERYLGFWTAAWGLWFVRHVYAAYFQDMHIAEPVTIPVILSMSYTTFVLLGAAEFSRRPVAAVWLSLAIGSVLLGAIFPPLEEPFAVTKVIYLLVLGTGWVWAGVLFGRADERLGGVRWIPAGALVLMGLHQWAVLILQGYPAYEPWGLSVTLALQIAIGVGVLIVFERRGRIRLGEAHADLEQALTQALAGHIPICAHCKSIRDEQDEWRGLEVYLSARTGAQFSHSICPDCTAALYPDAI